MYAPDAKLQVMPLTEGIVRLRFVLLFGGLLCASCGKPASDDAAATQGDTLTQRQRDSILAGSRIPGARAVGTAHNAADSASARVQITDTIGP